MCPALPALLSDSVSWSWVGVFCVLFFLCGGTIAWILGYQVGFMDGRAASQKEGTFSLSDQQHACFPFA
jgi:hypothetical protein